MITLYLMIHNILCLLPRVDAELKMMEDKHGIQRWSKHSDVYVDLKKMEDEKEKRRVADSIATCARERWFLLNLKAKFAGTVMN